MSHSWRDFVMVADPTDIILYLAQFSDAVQLISQKVLPFKFKNNFKQSLLCKGFSRDTGAPLHSTLHLLSLGLHCEKSEILCSIQRVANIFFPVYRSLE